MIKGELTSSIGVMQLPRAHVMFSSPLSIQPAVHSLGLTARGLFRSTVYQFSLFVIHYLLHVVDLLFCINEPTEEDCTIFLSGYYSVIYPAISQ